MERDPSGLLAWMVTELEAAETAGERVWIIGKLFKILSRVQVTYTTHTGHMPAGASDCFHDQSQYFDQIVQRFEATISGTFFG